MATLRTVKKWPTHPEQTVREVWKKLSDTKLFDEELEKDLCLLWDMTVEEDVVWFLIDNDVIDIIVFTLQKEQEPRLMEILIGMLANLCVVPEVCDRVMNSASVCEVMLKLLFCVDGLTLVQLMRLYITCLQRLHDSRESDQDRKNGKETSELEPVAKPCNVEDKNIASLVNMLLDTDEWYKQITFLLQSSTNGTLLSFMLQMLDHLYTTLADCESVLPSLCTAEMIAAVMEALKELKAGISAAVSADDVSRKALFHSVSLLSFFVDCEQGIAALGEMSDAIAIYICKHVDEEYLSCSLSLDSVQFLMRCFNIFGCTFTSLVSKAEVVCWSISLLGHLTERVAARKKPVCGEDAFEAEDKEEEERYFSSSELMSACENLCVFIVKCLSGEVNEVEWTDIEEILDGRCKREHLAVLKNVVQKQGLEEKFCESS